MEHNILIIKLLPCNLVLAEYYTLHIAEGPTLYGEVILQSLLGAVEKLNVVFFSSLSTRSVSE